MTQCAVFSAVGCRIHHNSCNAIGILNVRHVGGTGAMPPKCLLAPNKFIWLYLRLMYRTPRMSQVGVQTKKKFAPLAASFCTPFSEWSQWWRCPLLRWLVEYTYQEIFAFPLTKFWLPPIGIVWLRVCLTLSRAKRSKFCSSYQWCRRKNNPWIRPCSFLLRTVLYNVRILHKTARVKLKKYGP